VEIIVKPSYDHYNRALDKHIKNKRHYNDEMKRQGQVSQEKGEYLAKRAEENRRRPYKVDLSTRKFLEEVKSTSKNGKVKLSGRQIAQMEKIGVNFKRPKDMGTNGGMYSE